MARLQDIPAGERQKLIELDLPRYTTTPWVEGPPLNKRRVAIISSAAIQRRDDKLFFRGETAYRIIPGETPASDIVMAHASVNFDRSGFQQDLNVVFPLEGLRELTDEGYIGSVADFHFSFIGANHPDDLTEMADHMAGILKQDKVDAALLVPV